jgi:hypothetical protein
MTRGTGLRKWNLGGKIEDNVYPTPRRGIDQFPGVAASNRVLGKQDVPWTEQKVVPVTRLKVQCTAQGNDELPDGRRVPNKRSPGRRLLKGDSRHGKLCGQEIAARTGFEREPALLEMRVLIITAPETHASNHCLASSLVHSWGTWMRACSRATFLDFATAIAAVIVFCCASPESDSLLSFAGTRNRSAGDPDQANATRGEP